jgi:phage terminase large subunit
MQVELAYRPRTPLHAAIHRGMESHRFGAIVTHRRFGKTVLAVVHSLIACLENPRTQPEPRYGFIAPFLGQAKDAAWSYLTHYASTIPGIEARVSELKLVTPKGGFVRLFGADNPQSLRGGYFDGLILDEYGAMAPNVYSEILRPTLADYQGWAFFLGTPNGRNQFYRLVNGDKDWPGARHDRAWFFAEHRASETGIIPAEELAKSRLTMTKDEYEQEWECSFEASVKGAIYAAELSAARNAQRVAAVPIDPVLPVDTDWDLGVGDSTAIWFSQSLRSGELRIVDYYEASGEGFPHYAQVLARKGYTYGEHWAPHDIQVRELGSGRSRWEVAASLGIKFQICPNLTVEDGIHAVRMILPRCYFDGERCKAGLEALQHYRRDYNSRLDEFKPTPVHDWASHGADAFRYLAVRQKTKTERPSVNRYAIAGHAPRDLDWMS